MRANRSKETQADALFTPNQPQRHSRRMVPKYLRGAQSSWTTHRRLAEGGVSCTRRPRPVSDPNP